MLILNYIKRFTNDLSFGDKIAIDRVYGLIERIDCVCSNSNGNNDAYYST